jgi:SNF2 family N-terminal domain.
MNASLGHHHHHQHQQEQINNNNCNNNDDTDSIAIEKGEDVGFLFLNKTAISLVVPGRTCRNETCSSWFEKSNLLPYSTKWENVIVTDADADAATDTTDATEEQEETCCCCKKSCVKPDIVASTNTNKVCPRCNLVLYYNDRDDAIIMKPSLECYFDGTLSDTKGCSFHNDESTVGGSTTKSTTTTGTITTTTTITGATTHIGSTHNQRSDAILWMGTILKCQSLGFLRIESFKVLFSGFVEQMEEEDTTRTTTDEDGQQTQTCVVVYASIAITISLPHLEHLSNTATSSILDLQPRSYDDEYLSTNSNGFPPCGQLLFSLLRSDWGWLDAAMVHKCEENNWKKQNASKRKANHVHTESLFPKVLTLEELYSRLSMSAATSIRSSNNGIIESGEGKEFVVAAGDLLLPEELLVYKLAPFLRSKSLDNLRSTCRYLHHVLRAVVPGLKLQLYPHQVTSLCWMRQREAQSMTEYDAMNLGPGNNRQHHHVGVDIFRSVTSGGVVSVVPRRRKCNECLWLVNAWSGACWINCNNNRHDFNRIKTLAQSRKVARGGLLCDDPGLGKTITVLSLVLQTCGQSTEKVSGHDASLIKIRDQEIVDAYWREMLVSQIRQDELLALILKLRKCDLEQYFQYPVIDILSDSERDDYQRVIKHPMW